MPVINCRHFNGYKPCGKNALCDDSCLSKEIPACQILIVHLGALGAVVRATSLLGPIKRKFPNSKITWVTDAPAQAFLEGNAKIDRVLTTTPADQLCLRALEFDVAFVVDKSLKAAGVLALTSADLIYGFVAEPRSGAILPATPAAQELWEIGLSDQKKFFQNQKPETQLMVEALELGPFRHDEYELSLSDQELKAAADRKKSWQRENSQIVIGLNTGCSNVIKAKKWTVEYHRRVILELQQQGYRNLVLLGGPEDTQRNLAIAQGLDVISSPTELGLRDGIISLEACDLVVTGDSLGMHLAIARKKYVVAWFGPTCAHEIDLYGRGQAILARVACAPCWKRSCGQTSMCYDQVSLFEVIDAIYKGEKWLLNPSSLSKQLFSETSVSV